MTDDELRMLYRAIDALNTADSTFQTSKIQLEAALGGARRVLIGLSEIVPKPISQERNDLYGVICRHLAEEVQRARHAIADAHPDLQQIAAHIDRIDALVDKLPAASWFNREAT